MKSNIITATGLSVIMLALGSCSSMKRTPSTTTTTTTTTTTVTKTETAANTTPAALTGEWSIIEVDGQAVKVNGENHPKLTLKPDETRPGTIDVIGYNGCNYINGVWTVGTGHITPAGEFISTMMACPDAPYETAINLALSNTMTYTMPSADELCLKAQGGRTVMKLRKQNISFLDGAWKVTSIDGQTITADIRIVIDTAEGRIHGNAGCNVLNGSIIVNLDKGHGIEFQNLATTRMTCPDIATEQAFLLALEQVSTAMSGKNTDSASLCNASGSPVITMVRLAANELVDE